MIKWCAPPRPVPSSLRYAAQRAQPSADGPPALFATPPSFARTSPALTARPPRRWVRACSMQFIAGLQECQMSVKSVACMNVRETHRGMSRAPAGSRPLPLWGAASRPVFLAHLCMALTAGGCGRGTQSSRGSAERERGEATVRLPAASCVCGLVNGKGDACSKTLSLCRMSVNLSSGEVMPAARHSFCAGCLWTCHCEK